MTSTTVPLMAPQDSFSPGGRGTITLPDRSDDSDLRNGKKQKEFILSPVFSHQQSHESRNESAATEAHFFLATILCPILFGYRPGPVWLAYARVGTTPWTCVITLDMQDPFAKV